MTILVTGVAGFIGSHVAEYLLAQGHTVIGVDNMSGGYIENVPDGVDFYQADITSAGEMAAIFSTHKPEVVYHFAAYAAEGLSHFIRRFNYENNVIGSINLINEAVKNGVKRFIFTSSMAVYGSQEPPFNEAMTPKPEDPYGIAKFSVEQDLKAAKEMFDMDYVIIRPHNVFGERQNIADKYRNVVGIFMNQAMNGEELTIFGDGEQTRAFSYIDDVAECIVQAKDCTPNIIVNVGGEVPITINQLSRFVTSSMGVEHKVRHLATRFEVKNAFCKHDVARAQFEYTPTPLEVGLTKMAAWAKQRGPQTPTPRQDIEVTKNLYEAWK